MMVHKEAGGGGLGGRDGAAQRLLSLARAAPLDALSTTPPAMGRTNGHRRADRKWVSTFAASGARSLFIAVSSTPLEVPTGACPLPSRLIPNVQAVADGCASRG